MHKNCSFAIFYKFWKLQKCYESYMKRCSLLTAVVIENVKVLHRISFCRVLYFAFHMESLHTDSNKSKLFINSNESFQIKIFNKSDFKPKIDISLDFWINLHDCARVRNTNLQILFRQQLLEHLHLEDSQSIWQPHILGHRHWAKLCDRAP